MRTPSSTGQSLARGSLVRDYMESSISQSEDQSPSKCMLLLPICWALSLHTGPRRRPAGNRWQKQCFGDILRIYLSAVTLDGSNRTDIF